MRVQCECIEPSAGRAEDVRPGEKHVVRGGNAFFRAGKAPTDRKQFEARHTMDAPTTPSADNGAPGEGGWFSPHRPMEERPSGERGEGEGLRPAVVRRVGEPAADGGARSTGTGWSGPAQEVPPSAPASTDAALPGRGGPLGPAALPSAAPAPNDPDAALPSSGPSTALTLSDPGAAVALSGPGAPSAPGTPPDGVLIRRTMAEIAPVADEFTAYFYALLFVRHPALRPMFPAGMDTQRDRLLKALLTTAEHIDDTQLLAGYLQTLGRSHRKYGIRPEHYPAVGECLLGALSAYAGRVWSAGTETAWGRAYTTFSQEMIDAAAADELRAPAWWHAEIVAREPLTQDVTAMTVRPDQPYPYLAGQYAGVETPWWPRVWRSYSFASAPRPDGLLTFHVKAVPAGWVSNALVHRARLGDVVRLGAPTGTMTVDHTTDCGIVCVAGGTGIAPVKAIVEDVAGHGGRRPVEVVYGARSVRDLYELENLRRLQQRHAWLDIRPVPDRNGVYQLPHAVRALGPWDGYDGCVAGPPALIRSAVNALADNGVGADRIRHDPVEEPAGGGGRP